ncbi:MAG: DUF192 domain-containing protein [Halobacteriaceae archaeon]
MRLLHREQSSDQVQIVAEDISIASSYLARLRGLMFRLSLPQDGIVFRFDRVRLRGIHMLFVLRSIDVIWIANHEVTQVKTLTPWIGIGLAKANMICELPEGYGENITVGDEVWLENNEDAEEEI